MKDNKFLGAYKKSKEFGRVFGAVAKDTSVDILDIQKYLKTGSDGVHLLEESHKLLGESVAKCIFRLGSN